MDASDLRAPVALASRGVSKWAYVLVAICLGLSFWSGLRQIGDTLPYVQHIDERTLMRGAKRVLQGSDLNPGIYNYPSLPFYLTTAGLALGVVQASGKSPAGIAVRDVGRLEPPFYDRMQVGAAARTLWLVLGVASVGVAALLAGQLAGSAAMVWTALLLSLIGLPVAMAGNYIGVDVPLTLFAIALLTQLIAAFDEISYRAKVWIPAMLCGAAMASKYTGIVVLVPSLAALWLSRGPSKGSRSFELIALSVLVFLVLCPRFLLDLPSFIDGIAYESFHYRSKGHKRFTIEPGAGQLWAYASDARNALGIGLVVLSLIGVVWLARTQPRRAVVLFSFPICWLAMLAGVKVHFVRNLLPVLLLLAVLAVVGAIALIAWSSETLQRRFALAQRRSFWASVAAVALVVLATLPLDQVRLAHARHVDSRLRFAREAAKFKPGTTLLIPAALPFSLETLPKELNVQAVDLTNQQQTRELVRPGVYMLLPHWSTEGGGLGQRVAQQAPGLAVLPKWQTVREFSGEPAEPGMDKELSTNPAFALVRFER